VPQAARLGAPLRTAQRARIEAALVSVALFGANSLSYLLNMVAARALAPDVYGALGSLLAVIVVGAVPAMGMQTVAALLHLPSGWPVVWLGLALAPLTLLGVFHGVLQGHRRFAVLALLVGVEGVAKVGGALTGLLAFRSTAATLAGMAAGCALAAIVGWLVCGRRRPQRSPVALAGKVLHASQAILGLVLLVNLDIVLARHNLSGAQAGDYAIGVIITKIAYWLPQAVAVIVLPRFVDEQHRRRAVPAALAVIALLDAWVVLPTLLYGPAIIRLIGGPGYGTHVTAAWLFALLGSLLALVQLLLYSRIASADRRSATAVWAAVVAEILLVTLWLDGSVTAVASAALTSVALLVLAGLLIEYRSARRPIRTP